MQEITRESIVDSAKSAAAQCGGPLSRADFERISGIGQHHVYRLFPEGGWSEVKELAGIERHPKHRASLSDEDLLMEFHRIVLAHGEIPTWHRFAAEASVSADVIRRRFGGIQGTLTRYRSWLETHDPNSPILLDLKAKSKHEVPLPFNEPVKPRRRRNAVGQTWRDRVRSAYRLSRSSACPN